MSRWNIANPKTDLARAPGLQLSPWKYYGCSMSANTSSDAANPRGQPETGRIGIFWWWKGKLLTVTSSVGEGDKAGGIVDSKFAHIDTWPEFQKRHLELQDVGYEDVARGRVVYLVKSRTFRVLMDKTLFQPRIQTKIIQAFKLPEARVRFKTDSHYTTDAADLEKLFRDD